MQTVIFIGIQATGKSSFYLEHFIDSHVRINLDMLRTRNRESILMQACLKAKQSFVVDNTNLTREDRRRYIPAAIEHGFDVLGYYFSSKLDEALERNQKRERVVPERGVLAAYKRLELPSLDEGFTSLHYVLQRNGTFEIQGWQSDEEG